MLLQFFDIINERVIQGTIIKRILSQTGQRPDRENRHAQQRTWIEKKRQNNTCKENGSNSATRIPLTFGSMDLIYMCWWGKPIKCYVLDRWNRKWKILHNERIWSHGADEYTITIARYIGVYKLIKRLKIKHWKKKYA